MIMSDNGGKGTLEGGSKPQAEEVLKVVSLGDSMQVVINKAMNLGQITMALKLAEMQVEKLIIGISAARVPSAEILKPGGVGRNPGFNKFIERIRKR